MADVCRLLDGRIMTAGELGAELWPHRTAGVSSNGGGDYAAQMLLGRMRKAGLVRTTRDPGSSRWELTTKGHHVADLLARADGQARQLDALDFEVTRQRRVIDETRAAIAAALSNKPWRRIPRADSNEVP
jgi:hypothetical protein